MAAMSSPRLSVVIVTWNPGSEFATCIASLAAARERAKIVGVGVELVVVDNASADFPVEEITSRWPDAIIVRNDTNRGFGPACNQGAAAASAEFVLFLNPDTAAEGDPFSPIVATFNAHTEVVGIAPRLVEDVGTDTIAPRLVEEVGTGAIAPRLVEEDTADAIESHADDSSADGSHANWSNADYGQCDTPMVTNTWRTRCTGRCTAPG